MSSKKSKSYTISIFEPDHVIEYQNATGLSIFNRYIKFCDDDGLEVITNLAFHACEKDEEDEKEKEKENDDDEDEEEEEEEED